MPRLKKAVKQETKPTYLFEFPDAKLRSEFKILCAKRGVSMKERILELIMNDLEKGKE